MVTIDGKQYDYLKCGNNYHGFNFRVQTGGYSFFFNRDPTGTRAYELTFDMADNRTKLNT